MAITTTVLGNYSALVSYETGDTIQALLDTVENFLLNHGWTAVDKIANANGDETRRVYSAPCFDSTLSKVFEIDTETSAGYFITKVYEAWDVTNHIGVNLCYHSDETGYSQRIDITNGGSINIFASPRYALFFSNVGGDLGDETGNGITGIMETTRDSVWDDDATGLPQWFFFSQTLIWRNDTSIYDRVGWPRSQDGYTAGGATYIAGAITSTLNCNFGATSQFTTNAYANYSANLPYGVKSAEEIVFSLRWSVPRGRAYGIFLLPQNAGAWGDTANIAINANLLLDRNGTITEHHITNAPLGTTGAVLAIVK